VAIVGALLDTIGRWLLDHAPGLARVYALSLCRRPTATPTPGWSFAGEFYRERRWLALRRGALWTHALKNKLDVCLMVPWLDGTQIETTLGTDASLCVYVAGSFEPNEFAFLARTLRPGMTFIDVGANEGLFTLFAARHVGTAGRVIAAEPSGRERTLLERNIALNGLANVTVVPQALANAPGTAELLIAPQRHGLHNTLGDFIYQYDGALAPKRETVAVETLDALQQRLSLARVDVMKIDVEGAEVKVLTGGRTLLATSRPILLVEANEEALRRQGTSTAALLDLLRTLDYQIHIFNERGLTKPWTEGQPLSANIVAMPTSG
jgi:FkbM family methyltransferase